MELPLPTIAVNSGSGVHAYWVLDHPFELSSIADRNGFESMLAFDEIDVLASEQSSQFADTAREAFDTTDVDDEDVPF